MANKNDTVWADTQGRRAVAQTRTALRLGSAAEQLVLVELAAGGHVGALVQQARGVAAQRRGRRAAGAVDAAARLPNLPLCLGAHVTRFTRALSQVRLEV